jgi:hypothetical protein
MFLISRSRASLEPPVAAVEVDEVGKSLDGSASRALPSVLVEAVGRGGEASDGWNMSV